MDTVREERVFLLHGLRRERLMEIELLVLDRMRKSNVRQEYVADSKVEIEGGG